MTETKVVTTTTTSASGGGIDIMAGFVVCGCRFATAKELKEHQQTVHLQFVCGNCGGNEPDKFENLALLTQHNGGNHPGMPVRCIPARDIKVGGDVFHHLLPLYVVDLARLLASSRV